jgi:peptidylprolyl isomerase
MDSRAHRSYIAAMRIAAIGLAAILVAGCGQPAAQSSSPQSSAPAPETPPMPASASRTTASGLTIVEVQPGNGATAKSGDHVFVNYRGRLQATGAQFDSSYDRGQPIDFVLGAGNVIPGWDEGLVGLKVGGKRQLIIPPALGYGAAGAGPIPPNSTLVFDVELMDIR